MSEHFSLGEVKKNQTMAWAKSEKVENSEFFSDILVNFMRIFYHFYSHFFDILRMALVSEIFSNADIFIFWHFHNQRFSKTNIIIFWHFHILTFSSSDIFCHFHVWPVKIGGGRSNRPVRDHGSILSRFKF